jgi:hypothetical protein
LFGAPWLKDGLFLTTYNLIFASLAHAKVRDIIEQSMKVCNTTLIYNLFDNVTTQLILSTLFQPLVDDDKLIWNGERNGLYFVCNAYRICVA